MDSLYAADMKETRELRGVKGVHIKTVIFETKSHFLDYVSAYENLYNPIVTPRSTTLLVMPLLRGIYILRR